MLSCQMCRLPYPPVGTAVVPLVTQAGDQRLRPMRPVHKFNLGSLGRAII